ncbi:hypothetical protein L0U85_19075 [Glycomyces sp. L485]|uniref:SCO7613 C-terminal domain-containing membrane protein n=1 Tax=Glycomyces sp. L485 TaxID=2909235 RepID=UPI001F4A99FC|nr:hypothetical protein [Glycomyces sp. L485]MCH7232938.1 hypothetical protein [Glycomyces sp. L485]
MSTQTTPRPKARNSAELTTKSIQVVLLCLGGLLLTAAVIVFTAVAWRQMGDGGRLTVLAGFTGLLLAVPLALTRFRLWATAETLAAIATLALWCSALAGYYLYLPTGTGLTASEVAAWTTPVLIAATGYRIAARVSSPGWALLPLAAAGASFAAVAGVLGAALNMLVIGAVLAGAAWTVKAVPTRHTRSDQWSARLLACAAIVTVFLAGLRVAFGLDAAFLPVVAASTCLLASIGLLATVHAHREGASAATLAIGASATGALLIAAWVLAIRSADPMLALPAFALLAVAIVAAGAWTDPLGPDWLPLTAAAATGIASLGTLGIVLTDSYELTSFFGAAALALAAAPIFPAPLRAALRQAAATAGLAILVACVVMSLPALAITFGYPPAWALRWETPAIALACAVGLPTVPRGWRLDFLAATAAVAALALGGLWEHPWAPTVSLGLITLAALTVAFASRGGARRCVGWVGAYAALALMFLAAVPSLLDERGVEPDPVVLLAAAAGSVLLAAALLAPGRGGPDRAIAQAGGHAFVLVSLLARLPTFLADSEPLPVSFPLGFLVYAAAFAVAAWAKPARRVGYVFGAFAAAAVAHLLLMHRGSVSDMEAYTVPPAAALLAIGLWLLRRDPRTGSWTALAPALAIGFAPTLALSFGPDGAPLRRVLVGAAAVAVLLIAANRRWQAPMVMGAIVLAALSVNELVLLWSVVPKWVPLAVGGAVLIAAGATLEQRRRDLARLSGSVKAMR